MSETGFGLIFDPSDPETVASPYATYDRLRADDPVHWNRQGFWFLSRYADVHACLNDPRFSNRPAPFALVHARNKDRFAAADVANNLIAFKDAPEHPQLRGWVARCFARRLQSMDAPLAALARDCATPLQSGEAVDAVEEIAVPFASRAICAVLGLPDSDAARIARWSDDFFRLFHSIPDKQAFERLNQEVSAFRSYTLDLVARSIAQGTEGFITDLVSAAPDGTTPRTIADNIMLLAADGVGNVQAGLANCLSVLADLAQPPQAVLGTPKALAALIDECLRLESPGQYQGRITTEAVDIGGKSIRANSIVLLGLAAANRDPTVFADANRFNPARTHPQHLAFGSGAHMCMGNVLVRREISAALVAIYSSNKSLRALDVSRDWAARPGHRWLRRLDVQAGTGP